MPAPLVLGAWAIIGTVVVPIVVRILAALTVGFITYKGVDLLLSGIQSEIVSNLSGGPQQMVGLLAIAKVDQAVSMIFSAISIRFVLGGVISGSLRKMRFRKVG